MFVLKNVTKENKLTKEKEKNLREYFGIDFKKS